MCVRKGSVPAKYFEFLEVKVNIIIVNWVQTQLSNCCTAEADLDRFKLPLHDSGDVTDR